MCFQIEKRCCGSEVIASQSWKSSKKWMLWRWRCDVEVVRPQSCNNMHATAWRASLHHISTSHAKKRSRFQRLPLLSSRQVHPTVSQKFHSRAVCALQVVRPQSCNNMHATAWQASLHHISTSHAKKRSRFQRLPLLSSRQVHPHSEPKISQ